MILIRIMQSNEVKTILSLRRQFFGEFPEDRFRNYITRYPDSVFIADSGGGNDILGYAFAYPWRAKEGVIHHLYASQKNQSEVEKKLLGHLERYFTKKELAEVRVWTKEEQTSLMDLLESSGYNLETELLVFEKDNLAAYDIEILGNEGITILDFEKKYIEDIMIVETQCFKPSWHQNRGDFLGFQKRKNVSFVIALSQEKAVGYLQVSGSGGVGFLGRIAVLPEFQNTGIGQRLMNKALNWFKRREITKVKLRSPATYFNAHKLYKKFGFSQVGKEYDFYKKLK